MPKTVTFAAEGPGAEQALRELLDIPGIQGNVYRPEAREVERDGGVLAVIGTVVGIAGGVAAVVDSIVAWRERRKKEHEGRQVSVIIEDARGNRIALDGATPEQIARALQTLDR